MVSLSLSLPSPWGMSHVSTVESDDYAEVSASEAQNGTSIYIHNSRFDHAITEILSTRTLNSCIRKLSTALCI